MAIEKEELLRRLSFIRYLFLLGVEQSTKPEPVCNVALLSLHDSIELFLALTCEHYEVNATKSEFMGYFDLLQPFIELSQKESMRRFNKTRVSLKHQGVMTSHTDIQYFKTACENFFVENTMRVYSLDFTTISLIDLVIYEETKKCLLEAEKDFKEEKLKESMNNITIAFWILIEDYEKTKKAKWGKSPFFFGGNFTFLNAFNMHINDAKLSAFIDTAGRSITAMQSAMKIISLGLDYRRFAKFDSITPLYTRTMGGHCIDERVGQVFTKENVLWCFNYVIECCITLQNFEYSIENEE
jgi:hypothetical protein